MERCSSKRHLIGRFGSSWLLALAFCVLSYGQNPLKDDDPHATGYIPPTPEEERLLRETHPRIVKVWPNRLAWTRVNEERKAKGLRPVPEKGIAPNGAEKEFTVGDGPVISGVPKGFVGLEGQAGYVDNSLLDAFPEIRTQGSLGSCTTFALTYYQLTYTVGRRYGWNNKNANNDRKFSPKWTYNMINEGEDQGSGLGEAYAVLEQHGAATWSQFPYQTTKTDPKSYREWCLNNTTWRDAIIYRIYPHLYCPATEGGSSRPAPTPQQFDDWLDKIKGMLANGEVLTFPTYVSNWQFTTIKDDKSTPDDNAFVRKPVAYWVNGTQGGHVMTIVGYNDSIWTDINNNRVVDSGEKGALRIANSWGAGWKDAGFCWLAYDALRRVSIVTNGPSSGRQPAIMGEGVFSIALKYDYLVDPPVLPALVAKFKLKHVERNQLCVGLAASEGQTWTTWTPGALQFQGGPYAFDGTSVPCEGTFVFDFTDILPDTPGSSSYQLVVEDSDADGSGEFSGYKLTDWTQGLASGGLVDSEPIDADVLTVGLPYPSEPEDAPVAVASAKPISGRVPLTVTFDARGSTDSGNDISSYAWIFGDGSLPGQGSVVTHTYNTVGTYIVTSTVTDEDWAESSDQVVVTASRRK